MVDINVEENIEVNIHYKTQKNGGIQDFDNKDN